MKKRIALLMMAMLMVLSILAGCSAKKPAADDPIIGTWEAVTIESAGTTVDVKELKASLGEAGADMKIEITFTAEGKYSMVAMEETADGTWAAKSGKYELNTDGVKEEIAITDGKIVIEDAASQMKMTFEKQ